MAVILYLLHGATLALAWLLLCNLAATAVVAVVALRLTAESRPGSPGFWLAVRLSPAALSMAFVALVFVPSYWRYEPREFVEGFDISLTTLAALAIAVVVAAALRGATAWRRARIRTDAWMCTSVRLRLAAASIPVYAIDTAAPIMALVGFWRPRLLIARPVLAALTEEELSVSVAHELGHWRAWDNLKRLAMRAAPDLLFASGVAGVIERRWVAAAEQVADTGAGNSDSARCALASALVKVARLTPPVSSIAEPISALVDGGDITARVQRLLGDPASSPRPRPTRWLPLAIPVAALALSYTPLLLIVHAATEILVNSLP